jgi:hypothetical protein
MILGIFRGMERCKAVLDCALTLWIEFVLMTNRVMITRKKGLSVKPLFLRCTRPVYTAIIFIRLQRPHKSNKSTTFIMAVA